VRGEREREKREREERERERERCTGVLVYVRTELSSPQACKCCRAYRDSVSNYPYTCRDSY
jgi:hypothetical protein